MTRIAVIYYSASGNVHALARAVAEGAADELLVVRAQGARLARGAGVVRPARAAGLLAAKAPVEITSANGKE